MNEQEWLDGLKPGDEVLVSPETHFENYSLRKVEKRTPTQLIVLDNGWRFSPNGRERGWVLRQRSLAMPTPERLESYHRKRLAEKCKATNWSTLPLATLERVAAALEASE